MKFADEHFTGFQGGRPGMRTSEKPYPQGWDRLGKVIEPERNGFALKAEYPVVICGLWLDYIADGLC